MSEMSGVYVTKNFKIKQSAVPVTGCGGAGYVGCDNEQCCSQMSLWCKATDDLFHQGN
jgi:hypothetical protein